MYRDGKTGVVMPRRRFQVKVTQLLAILSGEAPVHYAELPSTQRAHSRYGRGSLFLPVYARPNITAPHDHTVGPLNIVLFISSSVAGIIPTIVRIIVVIFTVAIARNQLRLGAVSPLKRSPACGFGCAKSLRVSISGEPGGNRRRNPVRVHP